MYIPSPTSSGYFMLPTEAADKGLKLAGAAQLKVLIAVFRNMTAPVGLDEIAALTGLSEGDAADALLYWVQRGVIINTDAPATAGTDAPATERRTSGEETKEAEPPAPRHKEPTDGKEAAKPEKKKITRAIKPSISQINARCAEDPAIRDFFRQVQITLGKTIGYETQAPLLLCIDYLGLPPSVILLICEYAKMNDKTGLSYIFSVAEDWAHDGIETVEAANERIAALESASALWRTFAARVGISNPSPSKKQSEYLSKWTQNFGYGLDEILIAYDEMADHISSFRMSYMDKTLTTWHTAGLKNAEQIKKHLETPADSAPAQKAQNGKSPAAAGRAEVSYDIAAAESAAAQGAPVYERKKKKK